MAGKQIIFDEAARNAILRGVALLTDAVKATLGPKGRNAILDKKFGAPTITKDGVTVAKEIELEDKFENMGAQMVKEVASKTSDVAGDGTTTATVLAQAIYREGAKLVAAGHNPMDLKRGIDKSVEAAVAELKKLSKPKKILERIELCKKHWKTLEKETVFKENSNPVWGSLSGVRVVIKPYLKKARLYYKYL